MDGGGIHLGHINALGRGNGLQLVAQAAADGFHMFAVTVTADARAQNGLRQIVADVQAELAPHFLADVLGNAQVDPGTGKQPLHRTNTRTVKRRVQLAIDNAKGGCGVKADTILGAAGGYLNQGGQQMFCAHPRPDDFLAVHAVHQAHHGSVLADNCLDRVQRAGKCAVFQRHNQQIHAVRLLRRPDRRMIDGIIDNTALAQFFCPRTFGNYAKV